MSTVLASVGVTALSAVTASAQASAGDTMLYVANVDGGLGTVDATNGTQSYNENAIGGLPVDLLVSPNGSLLYFVDTMDDRVGSLSTTTGAGVAGVSVCDRPQAESLIPRPGPVL
ncbi:MAG TPA: hypothetical protein VGX23_30710 [Actinocrinis sp.]|nr:hypothetical protein [Actinocrinis sp.]